MESTARMEVNMVKRVRNRKRKRHSKNKRRIEVRYAKRRKLVSERHMPAHAAHVSKERLESTMQADTFWENYEVAQEWQRRHGVAWWRSRCVALEQENAILRDEIKSMSQRWSTRSTNRQRSQGQNWRQTSARNKNFETSYEQDDYDIENFDDENIEFQVDEDMMKFFEQSIRHKLELKQKRECESAAEQAELEKAIPLEGGAAWAQARAEGAKLLYGEASPRILAMETALQATMDRHKDKAKPQYWPNIPLKL